MRIGFWLALVLVMVSTWTMGQMRPADFLNVGINGGTANYPGRPTSQGYGLSVSADLNVNRILFANVAANYNVYNTENDAVVFNFGLKTFVYRLVYIHPYAGYYRILAEPQTVKRGSLGIGVGAAVPLNLRHINFEAGIEALPWYAAGTYYLYGKVSFPLFFGNMSDEERRTRR
ncbi:MAG: hypothetical protein C0424_00935 [Sphingobacteriaceae bacterium]|nr:hypothetical protein [Sphingobacteriaceae bacterium]